MTGVITITYDGVQKRDQDGHSAFDQKERLDSEADAAPEYADQECYRKGKRDEHPYIVEDSN